MKDLTMANSDPEAIRREIEHTKASLSGKLEALESEVRETVRDAANDVTDTFEDVKEKVSDTLEEVKNGVNEARHNLTLAHQVDQRPWICMLGAVSLGFLVGRGLFSAASREVQPKVFSGQGAPSLPSEAPSAFAAAVVPAAGLLMEAFGSEIQQLKKFAVGASLSAVRDVVIDAVPPGASKTVAQILDKVTRSMGGEPVQGRVFA